MSEQESTMKIHFTCGNCQTKYSALPDQAGKKGKCKNCGAKIVVPKSEGDNLLSETYYSSGTKSNNFSESVSSIFTIILYVALGWGEVAGLYHTATKHSLGEAAFALFFPPFSWYRSVELFWHDDYSGVNWEKRLSHDAESLFYLMNYSISDDVDVLKLNEQLEYFSEKVSSYPEDKKQHLETFAQTYLSYYKLLTDDFKESMRNYARTSEFDFDKSNNTVQLEEKLKSYGLKDEIEKMNKEMNLMLYALDLPELPNDAYTQIQMEAMLSLYDEKVQELTKQLHNIQKDVFNK